MPKHFPGSSKNINSFLSPVRWYSRVVRAILLWVLHAKYLWGIYTYGARAEKKVVYITRLSLVSNNKHYYIKYKRARRQMTSLTYELNPRGIEDEIVFCAPNERESAHLQLPRTNLFNVLPDEKADLFARWWEKAKPWDRMRSTQNFPVEMSTKKGLWIFSNTNLIYF